MDTQPSQSSSIQILMPARNVARFIDAAIRSIVSQTFSAWELIVVEDASTDDTGSIVDRWAQRDGRIKVIHLSEPSGNVFLARLIALEAATAEWVSPIDADDVVAPDFLETMIAAQRASGADEVLPVMCIGDADNIASWHEYLPRQIQPSSRVYTARECLMFTMGDLRIGYNGALSRRESLLSAYRQVSLPVHNPFADDLCPRVQLTEIETVVQSSARYFYRLNNGSITQQGTVQRFCFIDVNRCLIDIMRERYGEDSAEYRQAHVHNFMQVFDMYRLLRRVNGFSDAEKKQARKLIGGGRQRVDFKVIRGYVSPRYYWLLRLPLPTEFMLRVIDAVLGTA